MNMVPIDGIGEFALMLWHGLVNGLATVLGTWWGVTATIIALVLMVAAYLSDMGFTDYNDPSPFLTEDERIQHSTTAIHN